jgi:integrase
MRSASGSITRIDDARYRVSVELSPVDGKRRRVSRTVRGTRQDAEIELARLKLENCKPTNHTRMTVGEFWQAVYLPSLVHVKPRTKAGYESDYERLVEPRFAHDPLDALTPAYIERRLWEIESPGSQRAAFKLLRQLVNYAYGEQFTDNNPFTRHIRLRPKPKHKVRTYSLDEQKRLLDSIEGEHIEPLIIVMMRGGLRIEEACALYWGDLSFEGGRCYIDITKVYLLVKNKPIEQPTPKNEGSGRTVVISGHYAARLKAIRDDLKPGLSTPLVANRNGVRMRPDVVRTRYNVLVERAGLPRGVPLKNLRHCFASALNALDVSNAAISQALGHDNLSTAYVHYLAVEIAQFERLADRLAAADVARCNAVDGSANMDAIRKTAIDLLKLLARPVGLEPTTVYRLRLTLANGKSL